MQARLMAQRSRIFENNILTSDHFEPVLDARFAELDAKVG